MRTRLVAIVALMAFLSLGSTAQAFHDVPAVRAGMQRATDLLLDLNFEAGEAQCRAILALPQGEAPGRFCLALVALGRSEDKDDPRPDLEQFGRLLADTIRAGESLAVAQPADAEVRLLLG